MAIDMVRVIEKLDGILNFGDFEGARRHLEYWLGEAELTGDLRAQFSIVNEMIGLFRKCADREKSDRACEKALALVKKAGLENEVGGATAFINIATALKSFGEYEKALPYYEKAEKIYLEKLDGTDKRLGGLYNNMALALTDAGEYKRARECCEKATEIMKLTENGEPEQAITLLNIADLNAAEKGLENCLEENDAIINRAYSLLMTKTLPHNNYFCFVAEKCIPVFDYYGYFAMAQELKKICETIRQEEKK